MSFAVHTFEINPSGDPTGFAFHEEAGEGRELYFLSKFGTGTPEARNIAENIFGMVLESLRNSKAVDPYDQFEDALKAANAEARKHAKSFTKVPNFVIAFFDFHHLYLSQTGESEAYLVRGASVSQISETVDDGQELFQNILSGQVAVDDTVLLTSSRLLRSVTASEMADIFSQSDFSEAVATLRAKLTTTTDEDLVVTTIGVAKKEETPSAGFLSKVVSKGKEVVQKTKKKSSKMSVLPKQEEAPEAPEKPAPKKKKSEADVPETLPLGTASEELLPEALAPEETATEETPSEPRSSGRNASLWSTFQNVLRSLTALRKQKQALGIAGTLIGVLLIAVGVQYLGNFESSKTTELRDQLDIAQESFHQAETFLIRDERTEASEALARAQEVVQGLLNSRSTKFRSNALVLLADIQNKQLEIEDAYPVQPVLLADLSLKNSEIDAKGLVKLGERLFGFDSQKVYKTVRNVVEQGTLISSQASIIAGGAKEDQNTMIFLTDTPRIFEYREGKVESMDTQDETWKSGIDLQTFRQFVYLLDPAENQIWKYKRNYTNFSGAIAYNQGADLSQAVSMGIDGAIFILSEDGSIQRIYQGEVTDYDFRNLPSVPFVGKNLKLFVQPNFEFLYILDPDNARVLIFRKGERFVTYAKQLIYDLPDVQSFSVDDSEQKINILTKTAIYEFGL